MVESSLLKDADWAQLGRRQRGSMGSGSLVEVTAVAFAWGAAVHTTSLPPLTAPTSYLLSSWVC